MNTRTLRTATHTLALAAALLWLALPAHAAEFDPNFGFVVAGKGTLKLKKLPTLKQEVTIEIGMDGGQTSGVWQAVDDDGVLFAGSYYFSHEDYREFGVVFAPSSLTKLGQTLRSALLAAKGVNVEVVAVSLRPTSIKVDKKWRYVNAKLVFDVAVTDGGMYRVGTYELPLKGVVSQLPN